MFRIIIWIQEFFGVFQKIKINSSVEVCALQVLFQICFFAIYGFQELCISHCELWLYYSSSVLVPVGPSLCGALWLAALTLWHHVESCLLQKSLPFIVMTVCVRPSVPSILLKGPVMTYSFLLLAFLLLPESLCACLVCYYPFPTLSKADKACD